MSRPTLPHRLAARLRRLLGRAEATAPPPRPPEPPEPPAEPAPPTTTSIDSRGEVVAKDYSVAAGYPGAVLRSVPVIQLSPGHPRREETLNVFEVGPAAVSTIFVPIDLTRGRLFLNQTYEGMLHWWRPRPVIEGDRYSFHAEGAQVVDRRAVIIGGPIDLNYYHWMINWLPRLAILNMLRPDILADPGTAFFMDQEAQKSPYIDFLRAIGIGDERLVWASHFQDHWVKDAVLVSFGNQHVAAPAVLAEMRSLFGPLGATAAPGRRPKRLFISRQPLAQNRRRIDNHAAIAPVLAAFGIEEVTLEGRPIAEQIALFQEADFIGSVHGAGLTNMIFCRPETRILSLDSGYHLRFGASTIYKVLAEACELTRFRVLRVKRAPWPEGQERNAANVHNQDLVVPPDRLAAALAEMLGPPGG